MSLRELAPYLGCSPSLLSYLLRAAQAPVEDRARARRGEISTRALSRIANALGTRGTVRQPEAVAFERERAALHASKSVLDWFDGEDVTEFNHGQILEQARSHLFEAEGCKVAFLEDRLLGIVHASRNAQCETKEIRPLAWFALRLALWTVRSITDEKVRDRALELARGSLPISMS
jgi:hypothetical protein